MAENLEYVQKGFRILHPLMAAYIAQEMSREYKKRMVAGSALFLGRSGVGSSVRW